MLAAWILESLFYLMDNSNAEVTCDSRRIGRVMQKKGLEIIS